jgi:hypothetical protein
MIPGDLMANKKEYPIRFTPIGVSDSYDATDSFPGACRMLQNLIQDQSNSELVIARPGVGAPTANLAGNNAVWGGPLSWLEPGYVWGATGFNLPTNLTVYIAIGNNVYGMVSSSANAGHDQPFCYIVGTGFVAVTGFTNANTPTSPSTSGDWTPPTMAVIGSKIIVTHPGFTLPYAFGVIDITNPLAPTWTAQNTTVNTLPSVPTYVVNFNNRAWFACDNNAWYSDVLTPTVMTNAGQALTEGDSTPITGMSGLPVQTSTGGVVSSLIVFKRFQIWQIIGDAAVTGTLATNFISLNVGCISPRSICQSPIGTIFVGIDGPYTISPLGAVIALTKDQSKTVSDLQAVFQNIVNPGRAAAGFSGSMYRICIECARGGASVIDDYWFDTSRRRWSGPHSFPYDCISQVSNYFIISHRSVGASIFSSQYMPTANSVYTDNGKPYTVLLQSSSFPKTQNINEKEVVESTIELSSSAQNLSYTIQAVDDFGATIDSTQITVNNATNLWGIGTWGSGLRYNYQYNVPATYTIPWSKPLIFKKMGLQITASSANNLSIGTFFAKYRDTGYINK